MDPFRALGLVFTLLSGLIMVRAHSFWGYLGWLLAVSGGGFYMVAVMDLKARRERMRGRV